MFHSSMSVDLVIFSLHMAGVSSLLRRVNFIITVSVFKGASNTFTTLPLMVWCLVVTAGLLVLSLPVLAGGITMLLVERNFNVAFFDRGGGGDPVLFQHLF
jgi:heme/copper-type cytochrome/quinol oxidase subunit 1